MKYFLVLYATREGQTLHIAEHIAAAARSRGIMADVVNARHLPDGFSLSVYSAAILCASVHAGRHEPEMTRFVKDRLEELGRVRTVFLSVSLSEAGAEDSHATPAARAESAAAVKRMTDQFLAETGWHPSRVQAVAGALMYTRYHRLIRFVMKMIAKSAGGSTDTSTDVEYTDWAALDRLVDELADPQA